MPPGRFESFLYVYLVNEYFKYFQLSILYFDRIYVFPLYGLFDKANKKRWMWLRYELVIK